jgi:hypothetical protein
MVDGDIGFLFVRARESDHRRISLIPSGSMKQACLTLAKLKPTIDMLIINCQLSGVRSLARDLVRHNAKLEKLEVIGIVSGSHQCRLCRQPLTLISQDSELREARWIRNWASLFRVASGQNGFAVL